MMKGRERREAVLQTELTNKRRLFSAVIEGGGEGGEMRAVDG